MRRTGDEHRTTLIVAGVSGTGKTTVARGVAAATGWEFAEGDDFHPVANVEKMRSGVPLDDVDRWPWLRSIADWIGEREDAGRCAVVTCSALKRTHRDLLRDGHPSVRFCQLVVPDLVVAERLTRRRDHFMPAALLASQLSALEDLGADEPGFRVGVGGTPDEVVAEVLRHL